MDAAAVARRCAETMYAPDRASQALGIEICDVEPGRATARMSVRQDMTNGHDICHGGYVFTLADTAFAFACNTFNEVTVAAHADVTFLEPVHQGEWLTAVAVERTRRPPGDLRVVARSGARHAGSACNNAKICSEGRVSGRRAARGSAVARPCGRSARPAAGPPR